jgi:hypothetical protein
MTIQAGKKGKTKKHEKPNKKKREKEHKDDVEALFYVEKNQLSDADNSTQNMQH